MTSGGEIQTLDSKYLAQVATNPTAATASADNLTKIDCAYEEPFLSLLLELNLSIARTGESLEGNLCYWDQTPPEQYVHAPPTDDDAHVRKRINLTTIARAHRSLLEIGLNAGHSALLALYSNPTLHFFAVDIGTHAYTSHAATFLKEKFGHRFHFFHGDSLEVLPAIFLERPALRFDAIHLDGGHTAAILTADISNSIRMSENNATFIIDDINVEHLRKTLDNMIAFGYFLSENDLPLLPTPLHAIVRLSASARR